MNELWQPSARELARRIGAGETQERAEFGGRSGRTDGPHPHPVRIVRGLTGGARAVAGSSVGQTRPARATTATTPTGPGFG